MPIAEIIDWSVALLPVLLLVALFVFLDVFKLMRLPGDALPPAPGARACAPAARAVRLPLRVQADAAQRDRPAARARRARRHRQLPDQRRHARPAAARLLLLQPGRRTVGI